MDINWVEEPNETLVCFCSQVSKGTVLEAIQNGASDVKSIQERTQAGVGGRCKELNPRGRCCHPDLKALLKIYGEKDEEK